MFQQPLSESEEKVLRRGYQYAKKLIYNLIKDHHHLVASILEKRAMTELDMVDLFGTRALIRLSGGFFNSTFIQPGA